MTIAEFEAKYPYHRIDDLRRNAAALTAAVRMRKRAKASTPAWDVGWHAERGLLEEREYLRECLSDQCEPWFKPQVPGGDWWPPGTEKYCPWEREAQPA